MGGCVLLYRSHDLPPLGVSAQTGARQAKRQGSREPCDSGEMWECPDFFAVDGHHSCSIRPKTKCSGRRANTIRAGTAIFPCAPACSTMGAYYAPKSFLAPDGRRILWGWIRETRPEAQFAAAGWSGAMGLPRVLRVNSDGALEMKPALEVGIAARRGRGRDIDHHSCRSGRSSDNLAKRVAHPARRDGREDRGRA